MGRQRKVNGFIYFPCAFLCQHIMSVDVICALLHNAKIYYLLHARYQLKEFFYCSEPHIQRLNLFVTVKWF
jgi:hypothetical protein